MTPGRTDIQLRGAPAEVEFFCAADGDAAWRLVRAVSPPLTDYEVQAIDAIVRRELQDRQRWWREESEKKRLLRRVEQISARLRS